MGVQYDVASHWGIVLKILPKHGSVFGAVSRELFIAMVTSLVAVVIDKFVTPIQISNFGHTLLAFALGFLLVFRSNQSYKRYNEGRGAVGAMVRDLRNLGRQVCFFGGRGQKKDAVAVKRIVRRCKLFFEVTVLHLRHLRHLTKLRKELKILTKSEHRLLKSEGGANPHTIIGWIANDLAVLRERKVITQKEHIAIDRNLQSLTGALLGVKKVQELILPFPYAQLLMTFLVIFVNTLPFVIVSIFGGATPLITIVVAYALFGINEVGIQLEDPFGTDKNDLAMPVYKAGTNHDLDHYFAQAVLHKSLPTLQGGIDATLAIGVKEDISDLPSSVGSEVDSDEILNKQVFVDSEGSHSRGSRAGNASRKKKNKSGSGNKKKSAKKDQSSQSGSLSSSYLYSES